MREEEPLEGWLFHIRMRAEHGPSPFPKDTGREAIDRLANVLAGQPEGKVNYDKIRGGVISVYTPYWLSADEAADAQRLFLLVWERGGAGSGFVAEGLLQSIALGLQPASVPFWRLALDLSRPRDQSATRRRTIALAALALLAIDRDDAEAYRALADALRHPHEQVRALSAFYLARAYTVPRRTLPDQVEATLLGLATADRVFAPRFQARAALRSLGRPVPLGSPESVYFFNVQLRGDRATRTIAARADNTLSELHYATQEAFGWDADHLYSFYMNGARDERRYEIRCPELDDRWGPWSTGVVDTGDTENEDEGGEDLYTSNAVIGALGLVPKHKFIYFFDYGDSHEFIVTMLGIEERADEGIYPRLVEARGEAPQQYYSYDDAE